LVNPKGKTSTITNSYNERCESALEQALLSVPFYKSWKQYDKGSEFSFAERMAALPILTKKDIRANVPNGFIVDKYKCREGFASGEIEMESTSGTSEERVSVVWNQNWWNYSEREAARLNPVLNYIFKSPHREAILTSPTCSGNLCHVGESSMDERMIGNLLFLNQTPDPTAWDDRNIRRMAEEIESFQPDIIEADPAYLSIFSLSNLTAGHELYKPKCIVLTYEFPSCMHYRQIHRAFPGIPVVSSYGSTETGHVFTQCETGNFHPNIATCYVDVQPLRKEFGNPSVGRILVSSLENPWFVLLRYDIGDLVFSRDGVKCSCGRSEGLIIGGIEGRVRDITFDTKGHVVTLKRLDDALESVEPLSGYKVVQTERRRYTMHYSADSEASSNLGNVVLEILHNLYGKDAVIDISRSSALTPEQSGKFQLACVIKDLYPEELF
jgi:phenylacetate-coenzyme A ligase PaaK-like adenylate-forming protein